MTKETIRAQLLKQRRQLDDAFIGSSSLKIISQIKTSSQYQNAHNIALYIPINGEVDLSNLLKDHRKSFYIPAIQSKDMQFHLYESNLEFEQHQFGVTQPKFIESLDRPEIDICLMPLVGFDLIGNRIGMGGGYYDRYFAKSKNTLLAGVAYDFQLIDQLPADPWDVKLHLIFTEQKQHTI